MPTPKQAAIRRFCKLKSFRNAQALDPKQLAGAGGRYEQVVALRPGHFLVRKQVLQLDGLFHANRLKSVAWAPMPQNHALADLFGIKTLAAVTRGWRSEWFCRPNEPAYGCSAERSFAFCLAQVQLEAFFPEFWFALFLKPEQTACLTNESERLSARRRLGADWLTWRNPESLDHFKIGLDAMGNQLQLDTPSLQG